MTQASQMPGAPSMLEVEGKTYRYFPVSAVEGSEKLPFSLSVLLENALRNARDGQEAARYAQRIVAASQASDGCAAEAGAAGEIEFAPARVLFQDFTGVPVFVDFAAMREACVALGGDPARINPLVPCDLIVDHSVIADEAGCASALETNERLEFERNAERYEFLKWAQESFDNVRIVPPGQGICHQLNIERLASVVMTSSTDEEELPLAYFDTVIGTDSHTPTVNGLGVLGWGVGGIEAEAAALGQPVTTLVPRVVGVRLTGSLAPGATAMDVSLSFAERLRALGVVGCFVECFGPGVGALSVTQRACIANMTPEYGSTCTLFPIDERTLGYLRLTGRDAHQVALVEAYAKAQGCWRDERERTYSQVIDFDLGSVEASVAGPSRPHDRIPLRALKERFAQICTERGLNAAKKVEVALDDATCQLGQGALAIAAVTSCTTATDPAMMLTCGLLAKKAAEAGLVAKPWVKTILAPGSKATELLLERAGLMEGLRALGFHTCGFGCMSCIGNSGPLSLAMHEVSSSIELASALSGNRNFEGRISPDVSQNYLMTPALVVAFAIAGTIDFDMEAEPLGTNAEGKSVYLRDLWPSSEEVEELLGAFVNEDLYRAGSEGMFEGTEAWQRLSQQPSDLFAWNPDSTYVRKAPYFEGMTREVPTPQDIAGARVLALLGDFITTDHISPAGAFAADTAAGRYLTDCGVQPESFNTYGSRRGNHEVLMRGTFANVKLRNLLAEGRMGGWTRNFLIDEVEPLYDAACAYRQADVPLVVIAGKMYGSGSSRDWAAKGPLLLGVRAVIAESFERIHRSNLIGMGILPLQFEEGESASSLGLTGEETISIGHVDFSDGLPDSRRVHVVALRPDGSQVNFMATVRIDTATEGAYFAHGGILQYVLRLLI